MPVSKRHIKRRLKLRARFHRWSQKRGKRKP